MDVKTDSGATLPNKIVLMECLWEGIYATTTDEGHTREHTEGQSTREAVGCLNVTTIAQLPLVFGRDAEGLIAVETLVLRPTSHERNLRRNFHLPRTVFERRNEAQHIDIEPQRIVLPVHIALQIAIVSTILTQDLSHIASAIGRKPHLALSSKERIGLN